LDQLVISEELEDILIHFLYGRKLEKDEDAPDAHEAKSAKLYNAVLERAQIPKVGQLYALLCTFAHPSATSVLFNLAYAEEMYIFSGSRDEAVIDLLRKEFPETLPQLPMFAMNPGIVILGVLNYLPLTTFHTPELLRWDLTAIPLWRKCKEWLGDTPPQCYPTDVAGA
jgi:hypothetical protein